MLVLKRGVHWNTWNLKCIFLKGTYNHFQMFFLLSVHKIHDPLRSIFGLFSSQIIFIYLWPFSYERMRKWNPPPAEKASHRSTSTDIPLPCFFFFPQKHFTKLQNHDSLYHCFPEQNEEHTHTKKKVIKPHTVLNCSVIYYDSTNNGKSHSKGFKMSA